MPMDIQINNVTDEKGNYVTWSPSLCTIRFDEPVTSTILLRNADETTGGQLIFMSNLTAQRSNELRLPVSSTGLQSFYIAGRVDANGKSYPSKKDKDACIEVRDANNEYLGSKNLMVRIRKNVLELTIEERDNFLHALTVFRNNPLNKFQNIHSAASNSEIHGRVCFLPWHRAYLLHLERNLQQIVPSVTIPYWNFDYGADTLFTRDFLGETDRTNAKISLLNPLATISQGPYDTIDRNCSWDLKVNGILSRDAGGMSLCDELSTLLLGDSFASFSNMQSDPHKSAHNSFNGLIFDTGSASKDPLFFLLHSNIDRLWAKWQWYYNRFKPSDEEAYPLQGQATQLNATGEFGTGNYAEDTMWPWDGRTNPPNPFSPTQPFSFPDSLSGRTQPNWPKVKDMIDFQGNDSLANNLYFGYDDVPFYTDTSTSEYRDQLRARLTAKKTVITKSKNIFFNTTTTAKEKTDAFTSLGTFDTKQEIEKAFYIFKDDTQECNLRCCCLAGINHHLSDDEKAVILLIEMLNQKQENETVRRAIFYTLRSMQFGSTTLSANLPLYKNALRTLIQSGDLIDLHDMAIEILVFKKDEFIQRQLLEGFKNPAMQITNPRNSIRLLSYDTHGNYSSLFRELAKSRQTDPETRSLALKGLSADVHSIGLFENILDDIREEANIRYVAAMGIKNLDPKKLQERMKHILKNHMEDEPLQIALLNMLHYSTDTSKLDKDNDFQTALKRMQETKKSIHLSDMYNRYTKSKNIK